MNTSVKSVFNWPFSNGDRVCVFLCGDVMTGRGIDQILPHPSKPNLYEPYVRDANDYVHLAEVKNGKLPKRPVDYAYPWGDALTVLDKVKPHARIINLETSITTSENKWPGKGIHYRMHPENMPCVSSAKVDCCVLSNNHVLDWSHQGLEETLDSLKNSSIATAGAGRNAEEATSPAIIELNQGLGRLLVYGYGDDSSGVPASWAATALRSGVNYLHYGISTQSANQISRRVAQDRKDGDIVIISIHWGGNWGFEISHEEREFAHCLIDSGVADVVHGHSSHHVKALEIYKGKLILYGCGDFLNDYEGISGYENYHDEFTLMYFPIINPGTGTLVQMHAVPMQIEHMRLNLATNNAAEWLHTTMKRECAKFGVQVDRDNATNILTFRRS
ncbi:hypothetical protein Ddc_03816 [Ditylenchus destructor]|nr:hypothetical protein Ddc_03816 [Ditylenchus destructor]